MDLKHHFNKIDLERVIMVPILTFLMLTQVAGGYAYLTKELLPEVTTALYIFHRGLLGCFYLLIITLFFTRSEARATSRSLLSRTLSYAGTFTPFLLIFVENPETGNTPTLVSICVMMCGLLFAVYSLKTLGRSFGIMPQVRSMVTSGTYRLIRHPLYVGEIVALGGAILSGFTMTKLGIFLVTVAIQSYRAIQEENLLVEMIPEYQDYKADTKRFIPWLV